MPRNSSDVDLDNRSDGSRSESVSTAATTTYTSSVFAPNGVPTLADDEDLSHYAIFRELTPVVEQLTLFTIQKVRNFLISKFSMLQKPRTNIAIQQHNVLRGYRHLLFFLKRASVLIAPARGSVGHQPTAIAKAMYEEVKRNYVGILSAVYGEKMRTYIVACNQQETSSSAGGGAVGAGESHSSPSAAGKATETGGGWGIFSRATAKATGAPSTSTAAAVQPEITSTSPLVGAGDFAVGTRLDIFKELRAAPVIPHVAAKMRRRHTFLESFRSINVLLTDIVTSEFLFTFEFFDGDTTVYADVFRDAIQLVVDYVAEVILQHKHSSHHTPPRHHHHHHDPTAKTTSARVAWLSKLQSNCSPLDFNGLLCLIRIAHTFKIEMQRRRKIYCLDSYFDSVLLLLWPAFDSALEVQLSSLKEVSGARLLVYYSGTGYNSALDRMKAVHPLVIRLTALSSSLVALTTGTMPAANLNGALNASQSTHEGTPTRRSEKTAAAAGDDEGVVPSGRESPDARRVDSFPSSAASLRRRESGTTATTSHLSPLNLGGGTTVVEGALIAMVDMDYAESTARFAVLQRKLSIFVLELQRIVDQLQSTLAQQTMIAQSSATSGAPQRDKLLPVWSVVAVNTYYHVLNTWLGIEAPATAVPFDEGRLASRAGFDNVMEGSSPILMGQHSSDVFSGFDFQGGSVLERSSSQREMDDTASVNSADLNHPMSPLSRRVPRSQLGAIGCTTCVEDLDTVEFLLERARSNAAEEFVKALMPSLSSGSSLCIPSPSSCDGEVSSPKTDELKKQVMAFAKDFHQHWTERLEKLATAAFLYVADPANASLLLKNIFSRVLLLNSKLQSNLAAAVLVGSPAGASNTASPLSEDGSGPQVIAQVGGVDRSIRNLIVTNHQLMHHMKQLYAASNASGQK